MKLTLVLGFALLLHSHISSGTEPTYDELKASLPISLPVGGSDQYYFFVIPVEKNNNPKVTLQMAQVQGATSTTNGSASSYSVNTFNGTEGGSQTDDLSFHVDDVFDDDPEMGETKFNFQVPVVLPLHFRFTYNPDVDEELPTCEVDTRTWKENVISKIAEVSDQDEFQYTWDHTPLTIRIRLRKDIMSGIAAPLITTPEKLSTYVTTIQSTSYLADIRYLYILEHTDTLTADHFAMIAEGFDTYKLLSDSIVIADTAITTLGEADVMVATAKQTLELVKDSITSTLVKFEAAFNIVVVKKAEQMAEEEEEDEM